MYGNQSFILSKRYTDETVVGGGAIKGKNCYVDSVTDIEGGQRVTFRWELEDGTVKYTTMDVMNGTNTQSTSMPKASSDYTGQVLQYVGSTSEQFVQGYFYICIEDATVNPHTYSWENILVQDKGADSIQVDKLPTASASELSKIYQYVGKTTSKYTTGYFYQCESKGSGNYDWVEIAVQAGGGGGSNDYNTATHKPQINGVTLIGDSSLLDLGIIKAIDDSVTASIGKVTDTQWAEIDALFN